MSRRGGSLHDRFVMSFFIALLPFAIFAWAFKPEQIRQRSVGQTTVVSTPILQSSARLRSEIASASALANFIAISARAGQCAEVNEAVAHAILQIHHVTVETDGGHMLCDTDAGHAGSSVEYDGTRLALRENRAGIIVEIGMTITSVTLPETVQSLMLFAPDAQSVLLSGAPASTKGLPPTFDDPLREFMVFPVRDVSGFAMRIFPSRYQLIALFDKDYSVPPYWQRALEGAVLPISFVVLSLIISSILIRRLALDDVQALRREMASFGTDRALPQAACGMGGSDETRAMRSDFSALAEQLLTEEAIAQARLDHATTLQREVFHRVSNNFQIVQSIIRLIQREGGTLSDVNERIVLLSLAHHALHAQDDPALSGPSEALSRLMAAFAHQGWFNGTPVPVTVHLSNLNVEKTYALLHLTSELLRRLMLSGATGVSVTVDPSGLSIMYELDSWAKDATGDRLIDAYARTLGATVHTGDRQLTAHFDTEGARV